MPLEVTQFPIGLEVPELQRAVMDADQGTTAVGKEPGPHRQVQFKAAELLAGLKVPEPDGPIPTG